MRQFRKYAYARGEAVGNHCPYHDLKIFLITYIYVDRAFRLRQNNNRTTEGYFRCSYLLINTFVVNKLNIYSANCLFIKAFKNRFRN